MFKPKNHNTRKALVLLNLPTEEDIWRSNDFLNHSLHCKLDFIQ